METKKVSTGTMILGTALSLAALFVTVWVIGKGWKAATN